LSSIAELGLVDITTRAQGSRKTVSKVIKVGLSLRIVFAFSSHGGPSIEKTANPEDSKVLFQGDSPRSISGPHGTVITVKNLFHNVSQLPSREAG